MNKKSKQDFFLRTLSADEHDFIYATGKHANACIGYLRGFFSNGGTEFVHTWFPMHDELNTQDFKTLFDGYVSWLRKSGVLCSYDSMVKYCSAYLQTSMKFIVGPNYCFLTELEGYKFCLRCTLCSGDYHFRIHCYIKEEAINDGGL